MKVDLAQRKRYSDGGDNDDKGRKSPIGGPTCSLCCRLSYIETPSLLPSIEIYRLNLANAGALIPIKTSLGRIHPTEKGLKVLPSYFPRRKGAFQVSTLHDWRALLKIWVKENSQEGEAVHVCQLSQKSLILAGPITPPLSSKWSVRAVFTAVPRREAIIPARHLVMSVE